MAKMKKRKLRWKSSGSSQVVGYNLYWSEGGSVDYTSPCARLGNVNEIVLPDDLESFPPVIGPVEFGITAVDELGNESDMATLAAPYQFSVPAAPTGLKLETMKEYYTSREPEEETHIRESEPLSGPNPSVRHLKTVSS